MHTKKILNKSIVLGLLLFTLVLTSVSAYALSPITQSYASKKTLSLGTIVSLAENTTDTVLPAEPSTVNNLLGVVVDAVYSPITISSGGSTSVYVATGGTEQTLVSDINGPIHRGDYVTASSISGVGMLATTNTRAIGIAQADFDGTKGTKSTYKDENGTEQTVQLGQIPVLINVSDYFKQPDKTIIPQGIQNIANAIAGRNVSPLPIVIAGGIFIITLATVTIIAYGTIRSSIISMGRNPLAQSAIYRGIIQVSVVALVILGVGMIAIYLVLTKL